MLSLRRVAAPAVIIVVVVAVAAILATGSDDARSEAGAIEIVLDSYRFEPSEVTVPTGEPVSLRFVNTNDYALNLAFGREPQPGGTESVGYQDDLLAGTDGRTTPSAAWIEPSGTVTAVTIDLQPDSEVQLDVTIPPDRAGVWTIGCYRGRGCDAELLPSVELTALP